VKGVPVRYVFGEFILCPSRRLLLESGREVSLIPRYFDLLHVLIRRREEAIPRREILDTVWQDVVVSDGALSQAVRTLRRALGDDPRAPRFIRTVSRHGYQFVFPDVHEVDGSTPLETAAEMRVPACEAQDIEAAFAQLVSESPEESRRAAAENLHRLGVAEALRLLGSGSTHARARAMLRDARWDLPQAGPVPIFGEPNPVRTLRELFALRVRRVLRVAGSRYIAAVAGAAVAGLVAGSVGGLALYFGPDSPATTVVLVLLPLVGLVIAAVGASGVAAGLCSAEVLIRSRRGLALILFGAVGGGTVGLLAHLVGRLVLQGLFGQDLSPVAGGLEGVVLGAATGLGYALATPRTGGGMATPRGRSRIVAGILAGCSCALAAALLTWSGSYLGALSLDLLAHSFPGSQVGLEPLARLLGETGPGPVTKLTIGAWEGFMFALGTVLGLTHRPK